MVRHVFSNHSIRQLHTLHPDLQKIARAILPHHDFRIQQGYRGEADQNEAVRKGYSKVSFPNSKHNSDPSMAMDLLPFVNGRFIGWDNWSQWRYFGGLVMGYAAALYDAGEVAYRLRWGHDFNMNNDLDDQRFVDAPHYELVAPVKTMEA